LTNAFYNPTNAPAYHAEGDSATIRAEYAAIAAGFDAVAAALAVGDTGEFETAAHAAATYLPLAGGNITGQLTVHSRVSVLLSNSSDSAGFTAADETGNRRLELLLLGPTHAGAYGVAANANVINSQGALDIAINDDAMFGFNPDGNLGVRGTVYASGFVGNLSGLVTGNVTGNVTGSSGSCTGNAATATYAANSGVAASASAVAWTSVSGRPTDLSQFTNGPGYVTSVGAAAAGSLTGSTLAAGVTASSLTSVGTLTGLTVSAPISGSVTGSSGSCTGNAATATVSASCSGNAATATTASGISNSASNGYGTRTVQSGGSPSGGSDGDIVYIY
jgi:hypothetical protein